MVWGLIPVVCHNKYYLWKALMDLTLFILVNWYLSVWYKQIQSWAGPTMPWLIIFKSKILWSNMSRAFDKSIMMATIYCFFSHAPWIIDASLTNARSVEWPSLNPPWSTYRDLYSLRWTYKHFSQRFKIWPWALRQDNTLHQILYFYFCYCVTKAAFIDVGNWP